MANEEAKLFVAGLPDSISEDVLKQLFEATGGKVLSVSLPKDRMTGRPRGFGFVTLGTPQEAPAARGPGGGPPPSPDRTLYVGNLPYDATQEEVQTLVNSVVPDGVVRVHLPMDADGRKRGFGFVTMASAEAAKTAADQLRSADIRARRLIVNLAHPKGERPARPEGGGGGFSAPFPPAFAGGGGGGPSGPAHRKPIHEEKRKRSFEDGGGRPRRGEQAAPALDVSRPVRHWFRPAIGPRARLPCVTSSR